MARATGNYKRGNERPIQVEFAQAVEGETFLPYKRDPETLARPWAIPGTPGLEHRIGGLEKANETGAISYDADNHDLMTQLRSAKVAGVKVPDIEVDHQEGADVLVLSWGGTYGPVHAGMRRVRAKRRQGRARAPALAEPVPGEPRRRAAQLRQGA